MFIIQLLSLSFTEKFSEFVFSITDILDLFLRISLFHLSVSMPRYLSHRNCEIVNVLF